MPCENQTNRCRKIFNRLQADLQKGFLPVMAPSVAEQPPAELGVLPAVAPSAADIPKVLPEQAEITGPPPADKMSQKSQVSGVP